MAYWNAEAEMIIDYLCRRMNFTVARGLLLSCRDRPSDCIHNVLDGDIPVTGVLQKANSEFRHGKVQVVEVTRENSDDVLEGLKGV